MTDPLPANLVPEHHLIAALSPRWRQRFERAIAYLIDTLDQTPPPTWQQVAEHCALSAGHFHRMFRLVFQETPAQYQGRLRLQWAVFLLLDEPLLSVTEVAQYCGYSSSQALAKALQRELKLTARQIRRLAEGDHQAEREALLRRLGQPARQTDCLERQIARQLTFRQVEQPVRQLSLVPLASPGLVRIDRLWRRRFARPGREMVLLTPVADLEKPPQQLVIQLGIELAASSGDNYQLPAGRFLSCRVSISSEVGYLAVWDALYAYLLEHDLELDMTASCIEVIHNPEALWSEPSDMTISVPLLTRRPGGEVEDGVARR
ncbi:helix-turn-helix transcriptional regulator [Marinobacterium arenosum]|uniref:helix-turn-helix transcriptional regulator n=1 Tax=Marinobacterium arenosum TaxID=2862496 RepID=UPI001C93D7EB|nr:helix-turn-helix transcriptional regulator [Marinobacterium arenosum]MBY4676245.1 helix-turn-helix transcriptional regulator [Marinobacterium arenosum]